MCCMFKKELGEFEQNERMINNVIDASLVRILKKRRNHQDDPDLNDDDKLIINQQYQNLHASEKDFILFELLRDCGDVTTVAKVLDFLVNECHQEPDKLKVQQEIIRPLYQKPELKAWLIKELKNDGKVGSLHCLCLNEPWLKFKRYFIPNASYTWNLISFHLDYWKDLVFFLALRHYCTSELEKTENYGEIEHRATTYLPQEINSINLNALSWYILAMIIISHIVIIVATCRFLFKRKEMFRMNIFGVISLGALFPIHFSTIGLMKLKNRLEKHKDELVTFFDEFELRELDNDTANHHYNIIQRKIEKTEEKYIAMLQLRNSNGKWETLFEHLPSAVLITSLWLMSHSEKSLRKFLMDTFMYEFASLYVYIIIFMALKTATSCISAVIALR